MKTLIIAEKPSVGRDIARVLGVKGRGEGMLASEQYIVTWAIGHLVALCPPDMVDARYKRWSMADLPILPAAIPLMPIENTRAQYEVIKKLMHSAEVGDIICATDAGREGELIFRYIYRLARCQKPVRRLWLSSMTDEAIRAAMGRLKDASEYDTLYESARARSEADWLVGMNGSRAFTLRYDALLSVGRVQTPTLAILVRRAREIAAFKPENYWEVRASFGDYDGLYVDARGQSRLKTPEDARRIIDAVTGKPAIVEDVTREKKRVPPPLLYDLTTLQKEANKKYGFSAERTLKAAQALYENHKAITYPRTDSRHLPADMHATITSTLGRMKDEYAALAAPLLAAPLARAKRVFDDTKLTDHHAIVPTPTPPAALPPDEKRVYDMVARRLLEAFYPDYVYEATRVLTVSEGHAFKSAGRVVLEIGWRAVSGDEKPDNDDEQALPPLNKGDARIVQSAAAAKKTTKPPPPHTDASLLNAMEHAGRDVPEGALRDALRDAGLGTPATRAAIIERLIQVGYARRAGKALNATEKGMKLIDIVPPELSSPETTGRWERGLERIRQGAMDSEAFLASIKRFCAFLVERARAADRSVTFNREPARRVAAKGRENAKRAPKARPARPSAPK